jgi:choline dehydrogenase-like flavoprotein
MIIDARSLPDGHTIEADICIVGAGTAGLTVANEFANRHFKVCLIESGGLTPDRKTQSLYKGENLGHPYYRLDTSRSRYFGGSTNRWDIAVGNDDCSRARMRPLDPIDFEHRDWVPHSGWPFDKAHLDPFYDRAQEHCRIAPPGFCVADWSDPAKTPPVRFNGNRAQSVIFKFGSKYPLVKDIAGAITSAANIDTYLHANAIDIDMAETAKLVRRVRVACLDGKRHWVSARRFILATGAIEIPRLLLASRSVCPAGVGNLHDQVGRYFMEHLHFSLGVFVPNTPSVLDSLDLYARIHNVNDVPVKGKLCLTETVLRHERLLNLVVEFIPSIALATRLDSFYYPRIESASVNSLKALRTAVRRGRLPDHTGRHLLNVASGMDTVATTIYRNLNKRARRMLCKRRVRYFELENMSEQSPNPDSRVVLGQERDELGMPRADLDWQLTRMDLDSARRCLVLLDNELNKAGLGRLLIEFDDNTPPERVIGGWHHMGTTRMHTDPRHGVVDGNCRVHGIDNLFITGPSVFPTGGYANPSLTIVALALRLADHIKSISGSASY